MWDESAKLADVATRLRGQAYGFYHSCSLQQRTRYATLMTELKGGSPPVRIKSVDSSHFHERKEETGESVDAYMPKFSGCCFVEHIQLRSRHQ